MTVIIPRTRAKTKLMVGDLSRHINRTTSTEESSYYAKRSEKFLNLPEVNFQTILVRTELKERWNSISVTRITNTLTTVIWTD